MPGTVPTHNANMAKLCIMCCNQGQLVKPAGKGTNGKRVTSEVAATVKKHFMSDFDPDSFDMPNGLCPKHRKLLKCYKHKQQCYSIIQSKQDQQSESG